jgi:Domain of unknown function (DUF4333)
MKTAGALVLASALLLGLAGCSVSTTATVANSALAQTGGRALEKAVGASAPPKVDCGTGQTKLIVGTKIHCDVVADPSKPTVLYDSVLTITKVSGLHYSVDIKVANTPKN